MSFRKVKIKKSIKKNQYLILFFSILFVIFTLIMSSTLGWLAPLDPEDQKIYLLSGDIVKNFKLESFDGKPLTEGGESQDRKMKFEYFPVWRIDKEDIKLVNTYTDGDDAFIRYRIAMTNKINMFSTVELDEASDPFAKAPPLTEFFTDSVSLGLDSSGLKKVKDTFYVAGYEHQGLWGHHMFSWDRYIDWTHYSFGDIKAYNQKNNFFSGDLVMSFDIAQNPLPKFRNFSGDSLVKNFDYIAVASVFPIANTWGSLDDTALSIVGLEPKEYDSGSKNILSKMTAFGSTKKSIAYAPNINLEVYPYPYNSYDAGITPHTVGASLNPKTKDNKPIWNPEAIQTSMLDCRMVYNIPSFSPLVEEYVARLDYDFLHVTTIDEPFWQIGTKSTTPSHETYYRQVALKVTNRYIQTTLRLEFDIFASYKIDKGADTIEDFDLELPQEYFDLLAWLFTAEGFGGGEQITESWNPFGDFSTIILIVIVIVVIVVLFLSLKSVAKIISSRQQTKMVQKIIGKSS